MFCKDNKRASVIKCVLGILTTNGAIDKPPSQQRPRYQGDEKEVQLKHFQCACLYRGGAQN